MTRRALVLFLFAMMGAAKAQDVPSPAIFVEQAGLGHQFTVDAAAAGLEKYGSRDIRSAALTLMNDIIVPYGELKATAAGAGLPPPFLLNEAYGERLRALRAKKGPDFDSLFVSELSAETDRQTALFALFADQGSDASLKAYAAKMLPVLKRHQELLKSLGTNR